MYVYRNITTHLCLIPKGLYVIFGILTYNPFGIKGNNFKYVYKHTFPSGICDKLEMRYKADLLSIKTDSTYIIWYDLSLGESRIYESATRKWN
jgi:hypothetical protein